MALGKQEERQSRLFVCMDAIPRSGGHAFYDVLQRLLHKNDFEKFVESLCAPFYADGKGRPSIPPARYFRMHLVSYFEGLQSERGLAWRCADSLSLREFLQLDHEQSVPDHSSLSRIRSRLSLEIHNEVFQWVIAVLNREGLIKGKRIGIDSSTMEANAAMRSIVRKDTGITYPQMLEHMAKESGIATHSRADLARMDRKRKDKKLSNKDWQSTSDADARIARMKDKTTRMAYKPEHAVDLDTGAILAAPLHFAHKGDTNTVAETISITTQTLKKLKKNPTKKNTPELVADKGYFAREIIKNATKAHWKTRISEPSHPYWYSWHGDIEARKAVYANRARLASEKGKASMRKRGELVERSFQHVLDRGGQRRAHLRGIENIQKVYLLAVAGFNLGLVMRKICKFGTPKGLGDALSMYIFAIFGLSSSVMLFVVVMREDENAMRQGEIIAVACMRF